MKGARLYEAAVYANEQRVMQDLTEAVAQQRARIVRLESEIIRLRGLLAMTEGFIVEQVVIVEAARVAAEGSGDESEETRQGDPSA